MKTNYFVVIILFLSTVGFSQQAPKTVLIDFNFSNLSDPDFSKLPSPIFEDIGTGDYYKIVIRNINLNLYKISIATKDTVLSKPQITPTFGNIDLDALAKAVEGISSFSTMVTLRNVMEEMKLALDVSSKSPFSPVSQSIKDEIYRQKTLLTEAKLLADAIALRIDNLKLEIYKLKLNSMMLTNPSGIYDYNTALKEIESIRNAFGKLRSEIIGIRAAYLIYSDSNATIILNDGELAVLDKAARDTYDKFLSGLSEGLNSISADKINELLSTVVFIQNNSNNTYTSLPIQVLGEQSKIKITITPRDEKYNLQSYSTQIVFPDELSRYAVLGISFYASTLYDFAYSTIETPISDSSSNFNLIAESKNKAELGVTAMLRYGKKINTKNNIGGHLSLGAGVSISNNIKPRILTGGGLAFGKKHMLAADVGFIFGYVDRLSDGFALNQDYGTKPENVTVSKLGFGQFLSIGYTYQF